MEIASQVQSRRRAARALFAAAALALSCLPAGARAQSAPSLDLPIDCVPGQTCWISKFVDLDPGPGIRDYTCHGRATDGHSGIDIALRDLRAMDEGVSVLAAAPGTVVRTRDGVQDINVRDLGPEMVLGECGNGVVVSHGGGWETQYCHMRQGSILVKPGDTVGVGQKLGLVGMSGSSEYPHLHFTVRHGNTIVEPFVGLEDRSSPAARCGPGKNPLWSAKALAELQYAPASIFNIGFADTRPDDNDIKKGRYRGTEFAPGAPVIVFWSEIFGLEKGDQLRLLLLAPDGEALVDHTTIIPDRKLRWFQYIGKKRPAAGWPGGTYRGEVTLTRIDKDGLQSTRRAVQAVVEGPAVPKRQGSAVPPVSLPGTETVGWLLDVIVGAFLVVLALWIGVHFFRKA
jgi:murein DD-endopeptidase MepM/ murein hydrolase activator NlpD